MEITSLGHGVQCISWYLTIFYTWKHIRLHSWETNKTRVFLVEGAKMRKFVNPEFILPHLHLRLSDCGFSTSVIINYLATKLLKFCVFECESMGVRM